MGRQKIVRRIEQIGLIAVVRTSTAEQALDAARAICAGGVPMIEISMTVPGALDVLQQLKGELGPETLLGAGTVLGTETARACVEAGAEFVLSPTLDLPTVHAVQALDKAAIPGALTPTEVITAWQGGADLVKVFPCSALGGPNYLRTLQAPLPDMKLMPVGGVTLNSVENYFAAGARAVGVGGGLLDVARMDSDRAAAITIRAKRWMQAIERARQTP